MDTRARIVNIAMSSDTLGEIKAYLERPENNVPRDCYSAPDNTVRLQALHCIMQMQRLPSLAADAHCNRRRDQLFMNLGRLQELCGSIGGVEFWWRTFAPLIDEPDMFAEKATQYGKGMGLLD